MGVEAFDAQVKAIVEGGPSQSRIKQLCDLGRANLKDDAHLVSQLYRVHKKATPAQKIYALFAIDALSRQCRADVKKREASGEPAQSRHSAQSFLNKMEVCAERIVDESLNNGLPEHKDKVAKVVRIWASSGTFKPELSAKLTAKLTSGSGASSQPSYSQGTSSATASTSYSPAPAPASSGENVSDNLLAILTGAKGKAPAKSTTPPTEPPPPPPAPVVEAQAPPALPPASAVGSTEFNSTSLASLLQSITSQANNAPAQAASSQPPAPPTSDPQSQAIHPSFNILSQLGSLVSAQQQEQKPAAAAEPPRPASPPAPEPREERPLPPQRPSVEGRNSSSFSSDRPGRDFQHQRNGSRSPFPGNQHDSPFGDRRHNHQDGPAAPRPSEASSDFLLDGPSYFNPENPGMPPDFSTFDATDPDSWAKFGRTWATMNGGNLPDNQTLLQMIMTTMQMMAAMQQGMMGAAAAAGGSGMPNPTMMGNAMTNTSDAGPPQQNNSPWDEAPFKRRASEMDAEPPQPRDSGGAHSGAGVKRGGKMQKVNGRIQYVPPE